MLETELQDLGLSEKEAKVYLAALELGTDTVQRIAHKAAVKRATTYVVLKSLMAKGLVSSIEQNKKTLFVAEEPDRLVRFLDQKIKNLSHKKDNIEPALKRLRITANVSSDKPIVRFFEGHEGVATLISDFYQEFKSEIKKSPKLKAKMYLAFSKDLLEKFFSQEEVQKNRSERIKAGVEAIILYNSKKPKQTFTLGSGVRLPYDQFPFPCDIAIFKDKVRIISLGKEPSAVLIIDKAIAEGFLSLFRLASEAAKKHEEN